MTCAHCHSQGLVQEPGAIRCRLCGRITYDRTRRMAQQEFERKSGMVAAPILSQRRDATRRFYTSSKDASS